MSPSSEALIQWTEDLNSCYGFALLPSDQLKLQTRRERKLGGMARTGRQGGTNTDEYAYFW